MNWVTSHLPLDTHVESPNDIDSRRVSAGKSVSFLFFCCGIKCCPICFNIPYLLMSCYLIPVLYQHEDSLSKSLFSMNDMKVQVSEFLCHVHQVVWVRSRLAPGGNS